MYLSERQCRNRWKKRTYNCTLDEFFRRAPQKLKDRIKKLIQGSGYTEEDKWLPSAIYECYRVDVSNELCNALIKHYAKNEN